MKFNCLHCGQRYEIDAQFAGSSTTCQICGNSMKVPVPIGSDVETNPETVVIPSELMNRQSAVRRRHKWFRRIAIFIGAMIFGVLIAVGAIIIIETNYGHIYQVD